MGSCGGWQKSVSLPYYKLGFSVTEFLFYWFLVFRIAQTAMLVNERLQNHLFSFAVGISYVQH